MERYISLDVHAESSTCAVVGPTGKRLKMEVVETSGTALVEMIESIPGKRHLVFEEGTPSAWLCELLEPKVEELVVVSPVCSEGQKSDAKDAWALAEQLRTGAIERRVFKKPRAYAPLKDAVRSHRWVTQDIVRMKNRIKALYRSRGIATTSEVYDVNKRTRWLMELPESKRRLAMFLGLQLDASLQLQGQAQDWLVEEAGRHT